MPSAACAATARGVVEARPVDSRASDRRLYLRDGDRFCEAPAADVFEYAKHLIAERFHPGSPVLARPDLVEIFLRLELAPRDWAALAAAKSFSPNFG